MVAEGSVQIGVHTNNTAEIQALSLGIQRAKELGLCQVEAIDDSALVTIRHIAKKCRKASPGSVDVAQMIQ